MFNLFEKYQLNHEKLLSYGFRLEKNHYLYSKKIMEDNFRLDICINKEKVHFQVFDIETGDEYLQVKMENVTGNFVGGIREVCQEMLLDVRRHCFEEIGFLYEQTSRLRDYIAEKYQGEIEYLWEKSSRKSTTHAGVFRHQDTKKWYGVFMTTDWSKFDKNRQGSIEVINVKNNQVVDLVKKSTIYPAFHMNKKYWLSLPLDDSLSDQELFSLLDESFRLTSKKK